VLEENEFCSRVERELFARGKMDEKADTAITGEQKGKNAGIGGCGHDWKGKYNGSIRFSSGTGRLGRARKEKERCQFQMPKLKKNSTKGRGGIMRNEGDRKEILRYRRPGRGIRNGGEESHPKKAAKSRKIGTMVKYSAKT